MRPTNVMGATKRLAELVILEMQGQGRFTAEARRRSVCSVAYGLVPRHPTLAERLPQPEKKSALVSQVIAATIDVALVKPDERVGGSQKFARYLPFWACAYLRTVAQAVGLR